MLRMALRHSECGLQLLRRFGVLSLTVSSVASLSPALQQMVGSRALSIGRSHGFGLRHGVFAAF